MLDKKILISLVIFSFLMFFTSLVKNKTRIIEKNIDHLETKIGYIKNNLYEAQLDYFYLSSPSNIEKKILEFSDAEYYSIEYSQIYFSMNDFLNEKNKTSKKFTNEKE